MSSQRFRVWVNGEIWVDAIVTKTEITRLSKLYLKELTGQLVKFKVGE